MKKITLIFAMAVLVNSFCNAQDKRDNLQFGLKIGTNLSNVYDAQGQNFVADSKFGLAGGAFLSIPLGKVIGIQPEVLYSEKGFKSTGTLLGSNFSLERSTSFVDVPLLLAIKPISVITIVAGPQYSFLLKNNNNFTGGGITAEQQKIFETDNIRKNILSFTGGADINLGTLVLGLRASYDTQNNNGDGSSTTPRYKNAWYQATLGIRF
jgi:Outer membrane protein beta-barrel domain